MRIRLYVDYELEGTRFRRGEILDLPREEAMFLTVSGAAMVEPESHRLQPAENAMKPRPLSRPHPGVSRNG